MQFQHPATQASIWFQNGCHVKCNHFGFKARLGGGWVQLQMLLFPNALCCSLYERNCVCAVTKILTKFLPANNFCQLLQVKRKRSCTSAGNTQVQLHFRDDQQRAFGISNISNCCLRRSSCVKLIELTLVHAVSAPRRPSLD